ncbi:MAG: SRPBCC family protein [Acidimicrobiia bacterium]|nr:SRPBCC family protein [Acidimicrobiia bacterium]
MEIKDTFSVSTAIDDTWKVLLDVERIAPCLPGAQLQEAEGDEYRGVVKVKVGPITSQYKGSARLAEIDEPNRRIVIDAKGRDTRGAGDAKATIVVSMREEGSGTAVDVATELHVTGKVAALGRGMLEDVSAKLLGQFVENLESDVLGGHAGGSAVQAPESESEPEPVAEPVVRRIDAPEPEPVDLLATAGQPLLRRVLPAAAAVVVLLVLWRLLRKSD